MIDSIYTVANAMLALLLSQSITLRDTFLNQKPTDSAKIDEHYASKTESYVTTYDR